MGGRSWVGPGLASAGKNWLLDDHLEQWLSERVAWDGPCTTKDKGDPRQWALRVADGKVFAAMGKPIDKPKVERAWPVGAPGAGGLVRFKISMAWPVATDSSVTVVYSDGDDGRRQKRLLATSTRHQFSGRQRATDTRLLPTSEAVPRTEIARVLGRILRFPAAR